MNKDEIRKIVRDIVIRMIKNEYGIDYVPIAVSNRHVHLSREDVERLFGKGYRLKPARNLSQPGQYACEEKVTIAGPKGAIENVRVLGPERQDTQVEISMTDSYTLGIKTMVRMSGDLNGTPGIRISGPKGEINIPKGLIISARHIHVSDDEAAALGIKNGDKVRVRKSGDRGTVFSNVLVRAGEGHSLEVHIDTDEANAAGIASGDLGSLEK